MMENTTRLKSSLEECLSRYFSNPCRIVSLSTFPFPRQSSFALRELDVVLDDGRTLEILWKNTGKAGILGPAAKVRLRDPQDLSREIKTYDSLLRPGMGPPICYGTKMDEEHDECWLFLEKVEGHPLSEIGDLEIWKIVSRWLARFHEKCSSAAAGLDWAMKYDIAHYRMWAIRALDAISNSGTQPCSRDVQCLERLMGVYDRVTTQLISQPQRIIHGEFYPPNIIVVPQGDGGVRVCPVDWGTTAIGPALMDVAALVSGSWKENERAEMVEAYRTSAALTLPMKELIHQLSFCRIHIALQWVGWCPGWNPPPDQTHDWLAEACRLAEQQGII